MFCFNTLIIQHVVNHRKTTKVRLKCKGSMCQIKSVEYTNVRSLFVFVFLPSSIPAPAPAQPQIKLISISLIGLQLGTDSSTNRLQDSYTIQGINRVFDLSILLHQRSCTVVVVPPPLL